MPDGSPDAALLRRAAGGDGDAFEAFLQRHRDAVWRYLLALLEEPADADDAFQETFLAAWRGAAGFRGGMGARPWVLTIARHVATRQRRQRAGEPRALETLDALAGAAGWGNAEAPDLRIERSETAERVRRALGTLAPEDREVIVLRDLEDLEGEEVAAMLGVSLPAMKSRLHRARLRLVAAVRREVADAIA